MWCIVTVTFLHHVQIFLVRIFVLIKIIIYTVIHPGYFLFFFVIKFGKISMKYLQIETLMKAMQHMEPV